VKVYRDASKLYHLIKFARVLSVLQSGDTVRGVAAQTFVSVESTRGVLRLLEDRGVVALETNGSRTMIVSRVDSNARSKAQEFRRAYESFFDYVAALDGDAAQTGLGKFQQQMVGGVG